MRKGITPVVATIILLLVAIAISGLAYGFISGFFGGLIAKNIQITSTLCQGGTVSIYFKNIGIETITFATDLTATRSQDGGNYAPVTLTYIGGATSVTPNNAVTAQDIDCGAGSSCAYKIIVGGRPTDVTPVAC